MSKDSSNSSERPEIPCLYTTLKRMHCILQEETGTLEKILEAKHCQTPDLTPFCDFAREALKEIRIGEKILKIVLRNMEDDRRFWSEVEEGIKNIKSER